MVIEPATEVIGMAEQIVIPEGSTELKERVRDYWSRKLLRIKRLLRPIPEDQQVLRLSIRPSKNGWDLRAILTLPTGTLVAEEQTFHRDEWPAAMDRVTDKLSMEIRRHKEKLRHDDVYRRKRRREDEFHRVRSFLESDVRKGDRASFMELIRPLLGHVADQAHHELLVAQLEGAIRPRELSVSDLVDEVAVRAWENYDQRPARLSLDQWLLHLLHEVLDEYYQKNSGTDHSVEESIPADDPRYQSDLGWLAENEPYLQNFLTPLTLYQTLPDHEVPEPWQELAAREQMQWLVNQLRRFPHPARRAFVLHVVEGWEPSEIALLQNRSVDQVREDIERVRESLRQRLSSPTS